MDKKYIHGSLVVDGDIIEEFKSKVSELQRRLKSNQFNPDGYDLMNDRQQDVFIAGIFVDPMQAEGIDNYIEFGYDNCECPDVMDELYETCPALMSKVDKFKDRKDAQTRVTIEFLDRMMDMVIQEQLTMKPKLLTEKSAKKKAQEYEERVVKAMMDTKLESGMFASKIVDASATGPDAEFYIPSGKGRKGGLYFLEIKLNQKAQMGDSSVYYNPKGTGTFKIYGKGTVKGRGKFGLAKPKMFGPEMQDRIYAALAEKEDDIKAWIEALKDDRRIASYAWEKNPEFNALFKTTYEKYSEARAAGLLTKAGAGYGGAPRITIGQKVINQIYNSKKIYYIQIGGKGLYYMGSNPANLPIKPLDTEVNLELRPRPSSRDKVGVETSRFAKLGFKTEPQVDEKGKIKYALNKDGKKFKFIKDKGYIEHPKDGFAVFPVYKNPTDEGAENPEPYVAYGGVYSVVPRLAGELEPSPYTLDEVEGERGILALLKAAGLEDMLHPSYRGRTVFDPDTTIDVAADTKGKKKKNKKKAPPPPKPPPKADTAQAVQRMMGIGNRDEE